MKANMKQIKPRYGLLFFIFFDDFFANFVETFYLFIHTSTIALIFLQNTAKILEKYTKIAFDNSKNCYKIKYIKKGEKICQKYL